MSPFVAMPPNAASEPAAPPRFLVVDPLDWPIDRDAVAAIPEPMLRLHCVLPLGFDEDELVVAFADPTDLIAIDDLRTASGRELQIVQAETNAIIEAIERLDAPEQNTQAPAERPVAIAPVAAVAEVTEPVTSQVDLAESDDEQAANAIEKIIRRAIRQRASDVHVEPKADDVRVRFRVDGVLFEAMRLPKTLHASVVSRVKSMADLDVATKRTPQDGRMTVNLGDTEIDVRVATVPSVFGEEVVLRILDDVDELPALEGLGFLKSELDRYNGAFNKAHGAVLVVGPTGSGKSTTLYATLRVLDDVDRKIITVEDPVEYRMPGLTQIHVDTQNEMSFAKALRSVLHSDPDVVMVGEIRENETAKVAIEAALTGHRMLSTLHAYEAAAAFARLAEMGVDPYLIASAVGCVVNQRLIRKLCDRCKVPYDVSRQLAADCGLGDESHTFYRAAGCTACNDSGYRGRTGLFEVLIVEDEIAQLIGERATTDAIAEAARARGMRTLREDGMEKVRLGVTSFEEVLRAVDAGEVVNVPVASDELPEGVVPAVGRVDDEPKPGSVSGEFLRENRTAWSDEMRHRGQRPAIVARPVMDRGYRF